MLQMNKCYKNVTQQSQRPDQRHIRYQHPSQTGVLRLRILGVIPSLLQERLTIWSPRKTVGPTEDFNKRWIYSLFPLLLPHEAVCSHCPLDVSSHQRPTLKCGVKVLQKSTWSTFCTLGTVYKSTRAGSSSSAPRSYARYEAL